MKTRMMFGAALAMMLAGPAMAQMAQGSMESGKTKMSAADMKKMEACKAMSHDAMMKDKGCAKMMKMHPDMMEGGMAPKG